VNFSEYSKKLYPGLLSGIGNQGHFVGALFNAAGSGFFPIQSSYGTDDNQKKLFAGRRKLNKKMKDSFPKPIDTAGLDKLFQTRIGDSTLPKIMSNFGIPTTDVQDKDKFIAALCEQFQRIVSDATDDVDDIVLIEYRRLLNEVDCDAPDLSPLYPGDDFLLIEDELSKSHAVGFYEKFEHTWMIENNGSVTWDDRQLECTNQATMKIKTMNPSIEIPDTRPGGAIGLTAQFDARGIEGMQESIWVIKDVDGRLCFPDENRALKMVVSVVNRNHTPAEV